MIHPDAPLGSTQFEQSRAIAFVVDEHGALLRVTAGLAAWLGETAATLTGPRLRELLPAAAEHTRQQLARAAAGEVVEYETQVVVAGKPEAVWVTLLPLPGPAGQQAGVYGLVKPIAAVSGATTALLERERQLSVIFDNIADITFVLRREEDGQFRFVFVNKAFERTTGVPAARVVGALVAKIIPEPSLSLVLAHYQQALRTRQPVVWQEVSDYPSGRKTAEVSVTPVLDAAGGCCQLVGIVHDLTPQKTVEEDLRVSNERFQYVLKATSDALYDWNIAADTLYWGEGYEDLFGHQLTQNPTPFSHWSDHVEPDEHHRVVDGLRHTAYETRGSFWQQEYRFRRADGSWAVVFDRGYILRDAQGRPVRMIGAMQDITERKQAEERQRLMTAKLGEQNADLQQFTYIVSHNLRAPLANALGYVDLLSRVDKTTAVFDDSLRNLRTSLQRLDGVLTDVNAILSIRDQQGRYRPEPVAVAEVCDQVLLNMQELLQECGGELVCQIPKSLRVLGSRAYFHSIFHNLVSNAIKYRDDARPLRITISATAAPRQPITLVVRDNGAGFDQQPAGDEVFQLYRRFHADKTGRGIGLFLVKAHVESMGGQIAVRSQVGQGTEFTLYFRAYADENLPH
ncbi:PAS domain-containing protein [Hymenobacter algoricola]|uniref:histidine kinase n=1 Tax=Hymenobacter algoricola TaxID=486267 RepID=A0ABP7MT38_9BACT